MKKRNRKEYYLSFIGIDGKKNKQRFNSLVDARAFASEHHLVGDGRFISLVNDKSTRLAL